MDVYPLQRCPPEAIRALLNTLSLYNLVFQRDRAQFEVLVKHSQLLDMGPGEVVIQEGQIDTWLYFLIKGGLAVYAGDRSLRKVNTITPGEVFGDMAVLLHLERSATVIADTRYKRSIVLRLDFSVFGEPEDFSAVALETKLVFYRAMVNNLRWKLEVYRSQYPEYAATGDHRKIRLYSGRPDCVQELASLDTQARSLAELLIHWNLTLTGGGE